MLYSLKYRWRDRLNNNTVRLLERSLGSLSLLDDLVDLYGPCNLFDCLQDEPQIVHLLKIASFYLLEKQKSIHHELRQVPFLEKQLLGLFQIVRNSVPRASNS